MNIAISGSNSFLGTAFKHTNLSKNLNILYLSRKSTENYNCNTLIKLLATHEVDFFIHAAAETNVENAELNKHQAFEANIYLTEKCIKACNTLDIKFVFISSDYVFSGKNRIYYEGSEKDPLNFYGVSKSIAEEITLHMANDFLVARIGILLGAFDHPKSLLRALNEKKSMRVDNSRIKYPVLVEDVVENLIGIIIRWPEFKNKIIHISNKEKTTKYIIYKKLVHMLNLIDFKLIPIDEETKVVKPHDVYLQPSKNLPKSIKNVDEICKTIARKYEQQQ